MALSRFRIAEIISAIIEIITFLQFVDAPCDRIAAIDGARIVIVAVFQREYAATCATTGIEITEPVRARVSVVTIDLHKHTHTLRIGIGITQAEHATVGFFALPVLSAMLAFFRGKFVVMARVAVTI